VSAMRRSAALAALGALAASAARPARAQALTTIKAGSGVADPSSSIFYAQKLGLFAKRNLDVQITQFTSGASEAAAVAGGAIALAESNCLSTAAAHLRGLPFVYIAPGAQYSSTAPTTVLVCAKDAPYKTGKDLAGKTIGVPALRDSAQLGPMAWVEKTGGDPYALHYVELPASAAPAAIIRGSIDASPVNEPFVHMGLATGKIRVLANCFDAIAPAFYQNGWFTTTTWLAANRPAATAFAEAMLEAAHWANRNQKESAAIFKEHSKVDPEIIDVMNRSVFAERFDAALMQPVIDQSAKFKLLDRAFPASEIMTKLV
jgi:NitT/TauT family transport system substrate-binding protein